LVISIDRPVNMPPADGIGGLNPSGRTEGERGPAAVACAPAQRAARGSPPRFADDLQRRVDERNDRAARRSRVTISATCPAGQPGAPG